MPATTVTIGDATAPPAAISSPAETSIPSAVPSPVPTTASATFDALSAGRSAEGAVPLGATLTFYDRNAVGDKGAVTVLGVKDWDGTGPGDDSGVAIEGELTLAPQLGTRHLHRGQHRRQDNGRGALHVVIERADLVGVLVQDAPGVRGTKVLPVQHRVREQLVPTAVT